MRSPGSQGVAVARAGDADPKPRRQALLSTLARQPIFDSTFRVAAYELLYRAAGDTQARIGNGVLATSQVIVGATLDIGFNSLVGPHPAYINFPAEMLVARARPPMQPERVVIEVLEGSVPDDDLMAGLRDLRASGHRIALDDYDVRTADPLLLEQADIVKVDVQEHTPAELAAAVRSLRRHPVSLVAEKIETREELKVCRDLGFEFFQGYFLQKPEMVQGKRAGCAQAPVLDLVVKLNDPEVSMADLECIICRDVGLSYRILRCINSSYFGRPREISSIRQAVTMLGLGELQKLCWLMLLAGLDEQPAYVCVVSLHRARMCEALSKAARLPSTDAYFMAGMLSMLDVLLQQDIHEALSTLPICSPVRQAILLREGDLGAALRCAEAYERGDWDQGVFRDLTTDQVTRAYVEAAEWADATWKMFARSA